eukprot:Nitzschia sp. Nitz4//scaffold121_size67750//61777//62592//NITZ4_006077-RA/size67750-augustus-gene-0.126-mRNA-1//1//CDS//3329534378//8643//frame0
MSAYQDLATEAPKVEPATVERVQIEDETMNVSPAKSEGMEQVAAAPVVEPAVVIDDPKTVAPYEPKALPSQLSVEALRGGKGPDFESVAAVIQGGVRRNCLRRLLPSCLDERDFVSFGEVSRYVFIKGNCIFIYSDSSSPSPIFAIPIESVTAIQEDPLKPDRESYTISPQANTNLPREGLVTILLKNRKTGKHEYQITFDTQDDKSLAKRFLDTLTRNTKQFGGDVVSASVLKAKEVGKAYSK